MTRPNPNTKVEILAISIPLFATSGYEGVSMRQIAKAVGIQAASLYHYFPDKGTLYFEALAQAFGKKTDFLNDSFALQASPEERLHHLILKLCILLSEDIDFTRLMQREIMAGDKQRLQYLADHVFKDFINDIGKLCLSLAPKQDPHLMTVSILGLVVYHFQISPIRSFLDGFQSAHDDSEIIANHVFNLLKSGYR
jgi:TetR/AcrR family transcriptional regulator